MQLTDALLYSFSQIRDGVRRTLEGIDTGALTWRPDPEANSIAWLIWHLARVEDSSVLAIAGQEQVWVADGWPSRFGLPDGYRDTGYRHRPEQVAQIAPADAGVLLDYHERVIEAVTTVVAGMGPDELDRVVDESYDPPVVAGVRLMSVQGDALQHIGQAAYLRGLFERGGIRSA